MERARAIAGSALFFFLAPGLVAGVIPWWISGWDASRTPQPVLMGSALFLAVALAGLVACFVRFAWEGRGTPAPVAPTRALVITGLYRHVRNPMYVAVVVAALAQSALFMSLPLVGYAAAIWLAMHLFVRLYEEPTLRVAFPDQYEAYFAAVPRWMPRLRPWTPPTGA